MRKTTHLFIGALTAMAAVLVLSSSASAHVGLGTNGFEHGFAHPFSGLDHLLAMFVVGWWSTRESVKMIWLLPAVFVGTMAAGMIHGIAGLSLPFVEMGIAMSLLLLGVLLALGRKVPVWAACLITALSAFYHGHAHGAEMPATASALQFAVGMLLATTTLHCAGIVVGLQLRKHGNLALHAARIGGAAVACCGLAFLIGWM